jgi:tetratricopeptide (TPR) repeat protein
MRRMGSTSWPESYRRWGLFSKILEGLAAAALLVAVASPGASAPDSPDIGKRAESQEDRLLARTPVLGDPALDAYLAALVARLVAASPVRPDLPPIRAVALRDAARNAFSLPHGRIYLSTGLLAHLDGEDELAMILAREIAHLIRNDAARAAGAPRPPAGPPHLYAALGLDLAYAAAVIGGSALAERETDALGLVLLTRAGFDVEAAPRAFDQLRRGLTDGRRAEPFLFGSVPFLDDRRGSFAALRLEQQSVQDARIQSRADEFAGALRVAIRENAALEGRADRFATARAQLARALRLAPGDPVAHLHAGDLDRLEAQRRRRAADRQALRGEARTAYERAALLAPEWPEPYQRLGLLHFETGQLAAAREAFSRYLAIAPDGPESRRIREYLAALDPPPR